MLCTVDTSYVSRARAEITNPRVTIIGSVCSDGDDGVDDALMTVNMICRVHIVYTICSIELYM